MIPVTFPSSCDQKGSARAWPHTKADVNSVEYRAFLFAIHRHHGILLLHCTKKKKKGPHFQLPGGHIDEYEFVAAAEKYKDSINRLIHAAKLGASRELFEETGLDIRGSLERLRPAKLRPGVSAVSAPVDSPAAAVALECEYKERIFFVLWVDDEDFLTRKVHEEPRVGYLSPVNCDDGSHLLLKLSHEHSAFTFEKNMENAVKLIEKHSGGKCSDALSMARIGMDLRGSRA